jgi:tRNA threonylcarbamoyladenosine biosynthesis protein TsaE
MLAPLHVTLPDAAATRTLGARIAAALQPGASVHLSGELGSGKTTLAQGLVRALGFPGPVKSPSYAVVEPYIDSRLTLYHFDFFRFKDPKEWTDAGLRECFNERAICVVEWPEKAAGLLPPADLRVRLEIPTDSGRDATLTADSERGRAFLNELARHYAAR